MNFLERTVCILVQIVLKFVPKHATDNNLWFGQWLGTKTMPEAMMTSFSDAYSVTKPLRLNRLKAPDTNLLKLTMLASVKFCTKHMVVLL